MIKCILCESFSFSIICKACQNNILDPKLYKRELTKGFFIYSFYKYDEIKELINSKYQFYGDEVFKILASLSLKKFSSNFTFNNKIYAIPIDDHTRHDFSHTAILAKSLKSKYITVKYNSLKATNIVKYAGHDKTFREKNKRNFIYTGDKNIQVILVDDIITTGSTILEAKQILEKYNCEVIFALTLSDVKETTKISSSIYTSIM